MAKVGNAVRWARDIAQVLVIDRFNPKRRHLAEAASTACRSLSFHSRSKVASMPLANVLRELGCPEINHVTLPGPGTALGDVGSHGGYYALAALVAGLKPRTVLEFGTYLGVSALAMAMNVEPDCHIFTVDLPDEATTAEHHGLNALDQSHVAKSRRRIGEAFIGRPEAARITQIRADSLSFRAESAMAAADFVYVDGGHSLTLIQADTENAFRVLAPHGTIVWDDYFHLYPDVVKFIDQLAGEYRIVTIASTNYVVFSRRWQTTKRSQ